MTPPTPLDDADVEAVAKAMYLDWRANSVGVTAWKDLTPRVREMWFQNARAALTAAQERGWRRG